MRVYMQKPYSASVLVESADADEFVFRHKQPHKDSLRRRVANPAKVAFHDKIRLHTTRSLP